jgi:hypothetical protein
LVNNLPRLSSGKPAPSTRAPPRLRKAPKPSQIRYRPPATFNAVNASGDALINAPTPSVASTV